MAIGLKLCEEPVEDEHLARGVNEGVKRVSASWWLDTGEEVRVVATLPQLHEKGRQLLPIRTARRNCVSMLAFKMGEER